MSTIWLSGADAASSLASDGGAEMNADGTPKKPDDLENKCCMRSVRRQKGHICNRWAKPNPWGPAARAASLAVRRRTSAARKAAALVVLQQKRAARADQRGGTISEKFGIGNDSGDSAPSWSSVSNPLRSLWNEDGSLKSGGIDQTGRSNADQPTRLVPPGKPVGFSVSDKQAVFYQDGSWFNSDGFFLAKATPSKKKGKVFQDGAWYDAATGRTLGRSGVICRVLCKEVDCEQYFDSG